MRVCPEGPRGTTPTQTWEGAMMCGFWSRISNGSWSSWATLSSGARVPEVRMMLSGWREGEKRVTRRLLH